MTTVNYRKSNSQINSLAREIVLIVIKRKTKNLRDLYKIQREIAKKNNSQFIPNDVLIKQYRKILKEKGIEENEKILSLFRLKATRSLSGIVVVSVLTKPYNCPGKCLYCPTESGTPKSYLKNEPAVARALLCNYNPYTQVFARLKSLNDIGHSIDKINIRIIGGTWSYYDKKYQNWFIKQLFKAVNDFGRTRKSDLNKSLEQLQKQNEKAKSRIVEISIETRPDFINVNEIKRLRKYGVTKVELGIQSIYDDVLRFNRRGHLNDKNIQATKILKDAGFKISYQVMPNLPKSNFKRDLKMFEQVFENENHKPDYLKIYPLAIVKSAPIYKKYKKGSLKVYSKKDLIKLIKKIKTSVPYFVRIERIIRDIPASDIVEGGAKITNLRQIIATEMKKENKQCKCIRCRQITNNFKNDDFKLFIDEYNASDGKEYFISYETKNRKKLASILRLRIPSQYFEKKKHFLNILNDAAIIREIHTYGLQTEVSKNQKTSPQHKGYGKKMLKKAEQIVKENGLKKIAVISGVGARPYFRALGYKLKDSYMVKNLF